MRGGIKVPLLIGAFVLAVLIFIGISESNRRAKLNEDSQESSQADQEKSSNSTSFVLPPTASSIGLTPGEVKQAGGPYKGPRTLRVSVDAQQRVSFGLVPKSELSNYSTPKKVEAGMEHLLCGSGGTGHVSIACELPADAQDLTLVVADLRDSYQATRDMFAKSDKKESTPAAASYVNTATITIAMTMNPSQTK